MKIILINPPAENEIIGNNPPIIEEERGFNPPLGLLYLAAYLRQNNHHQIKIIDSQVEELTYSQLKQKIKRSKPEIVGITTMTLTLIDVLKTVKLVKEVDKKIKVILGGPHVHIFPKETINLPGVDYLVLGEGEQAFNDLINALEKKEKLEKIKGIVFKRNKKIINTGPRPFLMNLDQLPFPARDLVPYQQYSSLIAKRQPITTMITSRGCPFQCKFCDRPNLGKVFRARSAQNVVKEIEECVQMGINEFFIYDDTFTVNQQRVIEICDEIIKRKLKIGWDIRARVDTINKKILKKLKQANCERIHYGVETGSPKVLKALNKGITLRQVRNAFRWTKEMGIDTLAYFMIGNPQEGKKEISASLKLMKELEPDFVHLTILTPFPATKIYLEALEKGIIKKDVWQEFAKKPSPDFIPPVWSENFSREELFEIVSQAYKEFYTRPAYIIQGLRKIKSLPEFNRKIRAGLKVIKM
ncbi:MAG TPA: radical SAM protein [Patescibacteria group bacterium]|nr:radical SAM protein [Patescibacteria group bacterium]